MIPTSALAPSRRISPSRIAIPSLLLALVAAPLAAQQRKELGRMWTFEAAPVGWFQQAYDWQPDERWLEHARLSSLRFGRVDEKVPGGYQFFCSASFVSPHGLVMTNHHCARDAIAAVQGDADWLKDGYYSGAWENEVKLPGFVMTQMVRQQDVTAAVAEHGAEAVEKQAAEKDPAHKHQVVPLYQGGSYQLYSFLVFDDLRLVCAPHGQVAHFGGDPDNFCYPRWGLDFTFVRAWRDGKPLDSHQHFFEWRSEGAKEGDLVFVTGHPGRTGRLQTLAQCEFLRDHSFPQRVAAVEKELAELYEKAKDPAEEKKLRALILRRENTRKALQGYLDGLRTPRVMLIKQKAESELRAAVANDAALQQKYGDAWDRLAELQRAKVAALGDKDKTAELAKAEAEQNKRIGEACFAIYGTSIPPDATMSLRISDGVVKGYAMNGTVAPFFTTLYGLFARHHEFGGKHPFDLPQAWIEKEKELDLKTPFNFVSTNDIIGGNSGSPVIDKDRRIVGLIFDGNIESLGNTYIFDDDIARSVSVHPAIIVESLRKVYGAGKLADELEKSSAAKSRPGAVPARAGAMGAARAARAQTDVRTIAGAVKMYRIRKGALPQTLSVLAEKDERGMGGELEQLEKDPWGNDYLLVIGAHANDWQVVSAGPDGKPDTADDISSHVKK